MLRMVWLALCLALGGAGGVRAQEEGSVSAYVWGNSLINHPTVSDGTTVPWWLARMALADGRDFALSGQSAFGIQFPDKLPATPEWGFPMVRKSLREGQSFREARIDTLLINPENFIQYQAPTRPYEYNNPDDRSPVSGTVALARWVADQGLQPTVFLYEGWAEMDRFPPSRRSYRRYLAFTTGDYHDWYVDYHAAVAEALPSLDVRLIPVGPILTGLLTEGPLQDLRAVDLYTDDAPHGTPTTYLIAAMVTYAALYNAPPPVIDLPDDVHPLMVETYPAAADFVWQQMQGHAAPRRTAAIAPGTPEIAATGTGLANPSIAMGLNGIADWSTQQPFIDVMKTARHWIGHLPDQWGGLTSEEMAARGLFDADGWLTRMPEGIDRVEAFVLTDMPEEAVSLQGRYRVSWEGSGTLDVVGLARVQERSENALWFSYAPGEGTVALQITATDPDTTGDYIRNIRVIREDHLPLAEAGAVFNPDFINRIKDLRSLRYMDWMFTNHSDKVTWEDRARPGDFSYFRRGVPVEHLVALANLVGADPWFCMPHKADDGYVRAYAQAVRDGLDPRLKAYAEYSNELWNRAFTQATWADEQARLRWGDAAGEDGWMQFAGMRAAQVADIWTEVFGPEAADRLVNVIGVQTGWPGLEEPLLDAPLWQAEGQTPPVTRFQAYAVSGYFGHAVGSEDEGQQVKDLLDAASDRARAAGEAEGLQRVALREYIRERQFDGTIAPVIERLRQGSVRELTEELWPYHAKVAQRHGLQLVMYEGGTHILGQGKWLDDPAMTAYFHRLNYAPEMGALYADLLTAWRGVGGTLFNAFVDIGSPSKWGSWGQLRHLDDVSPRWQALTAFNESTPAWWEMRAPGTFQHGVTRQGSDAGERLEGTSEEDILIAGAGDDLLVSLGRGDFLHGGPGRDVAELPGPYGSYGFDRQGSVLRAWHADGVVHLRDIEVLRFADVEVATDLLQ
ncbi:calcium-binding protein [Marinovum sp.]|uniref:calcium-binding protein n=1 Tax=Marinovum sp. TaxID=2024839 RepID=UPI002B269A4F|nr:calcium-binding protein [Marinovum sp.]